MTFTFGIFINILFGMAVIDERVRPTSFSPVIKVNLSASVTKRAIGFSLITFQSGAHMFSHFKLFLLISNSMLKSDKLSFFVYLFHSNNFFFWNYISEITALGKFQLICNGETAAMFTNFALPCETK